MKIINFHTHIFADAIAKRAISTLAEKSNKIPSYDGTAGGLIADMKKTGVDISVVQPVATKPTQCETINRWASELNGKDGLVFFGALHPDCENYREIIANIKASGLKGVKLHPDYQGFFADEKRMYPIYEEIFSNGLILLFHSGVDIGLPPPVHLTPDRAVTLARDFDGAKMVFAHLGGFMLYKETARAFGKAFENGIPSGVYIDTSMGSLYYGADEFGALLDLFTEDKLLFATDGPWGYAEREIAAQTEMIKKAAGNGYEKITEKIMHKNAEKLLGI